MFFQLQLIGFINKNTMESKKYFVRYLPVEGEIKTGDVFTVAAPLGNKYKANEVKNGYVYVTTPKSFRFGLKECTIHKLFLCSRAIQVGDEVQDGDNFICKIPNELDLENALDNNFFKVIGEVSPDANWVKEGDEFEEDEVNKQWYDDSGSSDNPWQDWFGNLEDDVITNEFIRFQIKGPCGHFH